MVAQQGTEIVPYSARLGVSTIVERGQLSEDQVAYFVNQFKGCPQSDIRGFFWIVERYQLNPFGQSQIHGIPRTVHVKVGDGWEDQKRLTIVIGINGQVKIAQSTGRYAGMTEPMWAGKDGIWRPIWNQGHFIDVKKRGRGGKSYDAKELVLDPPEAAKVGVTVKGVAAPSWAVANWLESADFDDQGEPRNVWKAKPALMLAKTAASLALRRTFQAEFQSLREQMPGRVAITVDDDPAGALYAPDSERPVIHEGFVVPGEDEDGPQDEEDGDAIGAPPSDPPPDPPVTEAAAIPPRQPATAREVGDQGDPTEFWSYARGALGLSPTEAAGALGATSMLAWLHEDKSRTWAGALAALMEATAPDPAGASGDEDDGTRPACVPDGAPVDADAAAAWEAVQSPAGDPVNERRRR